MKLHLNFDLDSVTTNWPKAARNWVAKNYPEEKRMTLSDQKIWDFASCYPHIKEKIEKMYFCPGKGFYRNLEPIEGAIEKITLLAKQGHHISFVSSPLPIGRPEYLKHYNGSEILQKKFYDQVVEEKSSFLAEKFSHIDYDFHPAHDKTLIGGDFHFDDNPNADKGSRIPSWQLIVFDVGYGWLEDYHGRKVNWNNILEFVSIASLSSS